MRERCGPACRTYLDPVVDPRDQVLRRVVPKWDQLGANGREYAGMRFSSGVHEERDRDERSVLVEEPVGDHLVQELLSAELIDRLEHLRACARACARVRERVSVCACVCVCARARAQLRVRVHS